MIIKDNDMIKIDLEIRDGKIGEWIIVSTYYCNNFLSAETKVKAMKKMYALHNKDYKIYYTIPSKFNKKVKNVN